jgi:uncharacterized protein YgfB (UPF0149 family)
MQVGTSTARRMMGTNQGFDVLAAALADAGSALGLAELHGALCGVLCAGGPEVARGWLDQCLSDCDVGADDEFCAPFHALHLRSWRALDAAGMEFAPMLPDDDTPLSDRVEALASWCHGFVTGLGLGRLRLDDDPADRHAEVREVVRDFIEIGKAGVDADVDTDLDRAEFSFVELTEFVRVGAQIVFEEIGVRRMANPEFTSEVED